MSSDDRVESDDGRRGLIGFIKRHRKVLFFATLVWLVLLMGMGITLSTMEVSRGLHVFGSQHWVAGEERVIRVALKNLERGGTLALRNVEAHFVDAEGEASPAQNVSSSVGPFIQGGVLAPRRAGTYSLILKAEDSKQTLIAETTIEIRARMDPIAFPLAPTKPLRKEQDMGPVDLHVFPIDSIMPGALPGQLVFFSGTPTQTIDVIVKHGVSRPPIPEQITTDARGLSTIDIRPDRPWFEFALVTGESRAERTIKQTPTQFILETDHPIVKPGPMPFSLQSLHRNGPVFVDLWRGEHWLKSIGVELKDGRAEGQMLIPPLTGADELVWIQAYRDPYMPGEARGARHLLVSQSDARDSLRKLMTQMHQGGFSPRGAMRPDGVDSSLPVETWSRLILGRLPRPAHDPPLLTDSSESAKQTVAGIKSVWIGRMATGMALGGALLFGVLVLLIRSNQAEVTRKWREAGGDEEGDIGTRKRILIDAGYMFLIIAFFVIGMIQVMLSVRW